MAATRRRTILVVLSGLLVLAAAGWLLTSEWVIPSLRRIVRRPRTAGPQALVDQKPLVTAENLAALATISREQQFAEEALRLADQDVDLAFSTALRHATEKPLPLTPEVRQIQARLREQEDRVQGEQDEIAALTKSLEKARGETKDRLEDQLQTAKARLALDEDELADARRDLERAGGDEHARLQRELDAHEKFQAHSVNAPAAPGSAAAQGTPPGTTTRSMVAEFLHWNAMRSEYDQLLQAQQDAKSRAAELTQQHDALEQQQKQGVAPSAAPASPSGSSHSGSSGAAKQIGPASPALSRVKRAQLDLADLDKRIDAEQKLADVYTQWSALVHTRQLLSLHRLMRSAFWIILIVFAAFLAEGFVSRFFVGVAPDRKRLLTARSLVRFAMRAAGVILILLILFGPPGQLGTVLALAGAGLTVALKDFIVGFLGWFVLMGRNGVRPGDWVEINGVQGKVIDVGLFHTVLLETGNWTAAGHPTGRKVTLVNSYAIEGHYFNFSTAGQWLWDEIQVGLPRGANSSQVIADIQKLVLAETEASSRLAEQEWQHAASASGFHALSAAPAISVRPTDLGLNVIVRYVTRADERVELRSRLYRAIFEFLIRKNVLHPAPHAEP